MNKKSQTNLKLVFFMFLIDMAMFFVFDDNLIKRGAKS
jgi:hypothetical protein